MSPGPADSGRPQVVPVGLEREAPRCVDLWAEAQQQRRKGHSTFWKQEPAALAACMRPGEERPDRSGHGA